ncbi:adenylate/guanylate cyclase domain-containing protein [Pikeienuella sp. HZG-20]|uniref:adenylate/guanylate cyclase domain-containing protein n=1 Tax=Paludibacillus litoralis TaxID=3133267 RepID=UPI0030EDA49A
MKRRAPAAAASIIEWLVADALESTPLEKTFDRLIRTLRDEGLDIERAYLAHPTLHPLYRGSAVLWTLEGGLSLETLSDNEEDAPEIWGQSPIRHAATHDVTRLRRRLQGPGAMLDFPILEKLAAEGMTDYLLIGARFDGFRSHGLLDRKLEGRARSGMVCTFVTRRPGGFSDEEIQTLDWLRRPLAVIVKVADQRQVARALAECYIGKEAGPRVLHGAIRRGDFDSTEAVVWLSDLRASTEMSMTMSRAEFFGAINAFFDCTAGAVEAEGGEPMNFIGDSALAIFSVDRMGADGARRAALRAADRAQAALDALNAERRAEGRRPLAWGLALHAGTLDYGNIGSPTRHLWSVIGSVVNETARLEGVTKLVGEPVVASRAFVSGLKEGGAEWRSMGAFPLAGVPGEFDVFAPPLEAEKKEDAA